MKYEIYKGKENMFHWRLKAANGKIIADSGEGYNNRADCLAGINLVKSSKDAPVEG